MLKKNSKMVKLCLLFNTFIFTDVLFCPYLALVTLFFLFLLHLSKLYVNS